MKKSIKIISVLLVICMAMSMMTYAEGEMRIYSEERITVLPGGEFVVPVYIENNSGIASFDIMIDYDREVVEAVEGSEKVGEVAPMVLANPKYQSKPIMYASGMHHSNFNGNGTLFTYTFRMKDVSVTETQLEISYATVGVIGDDYSVTKKQLILGNGEKDSSAFTINVVVDGIEDITPAEPEITTTPEPTVVPSSPNHGVLPGSGIGVTPVQTTTPVPGGISEGASAKFKADAADVKYFAPLSESEFGPDKLATRYQVVEALYEILDFENIVEQEIKFGDVDDAHKNMVNAFSQTPIIDGYPDGTFGGELSITRAEFVKVVSVATGIEPNKDIEIDLTDVEGHWSEGYVKSFVDAGYIYGYLDKTFMPDWNIKRCEAVAIINRVIGKKALDVKESKYADLINHWAIGEIEAAVK